jgi:hypothetical protein
VEDLNKPLVEKAEKLLTIDIPGLGARMATLQIEEAFGIPLTWEEAERITEWPQGIMIPFFKFFEGLNVADYSSFWKRYIGLCARPLYEEGVSRIELLKNLYIQTMIEAQYTAIPPAVELGDPSKQDIPLEKPEPFLYGKLPKKMQRN